VFGSGAYNADYLIIVDSPSAEDVEQGVLLSGEEGELVEDMLCRAGIDPMKNTFYTSVVGCHPYVLIPATDDSPERVQSRSPDKPEVEACRPRLEKIIYLVDPRIIVAMGDVAWKAVVPGKLRGRHKTISTAAGELFEVWVPGVLRQIRYPCMATLSPKQLVANPSSAAHGPISTTIEALMRASRYVNTLKKKEIQHGDQKSAVSVLSCGGEHGGD